MNNIKNQDFIQYQRDKCPTGLLGQICPDGKERVKEHKTSESLVLNNLSEL